jgi:hypothetical protein
MTRRASTTLRMIPKRGTLNSKLSNKGPTNGEAKG